MRWPRPPPWPLFPAGGTTTPAVIPDTVFLGIGEIAVSGPEDIPELFIGSAVDIPVLDDERDGGPGGLPLKGTGEDFDQILLLPG